MQLWLYIFLLFSYCSSQAANALLAIILMVKNEETVINKTLKPFIDAKVDSYLIYDTGSTDNTVQTVRDYFKENNILQGYIIQEQFIDFATSRNRSIELAKQHFPHATFFLIIDAEWYVHNVKELLEFCTKNESCPCPVYMMHMHMGSYHMDTPRLMKADSDARFKGVVHEVLIASQYDKTMPADIYIEYAPTYKGIEKTRQRWLQDAQLLFKSYQENPQDPRTVFYLAQTYECLQEYHEAYSFYKIRSVMNGYDEENYETFFRLARVTELLSKTDIHFTWHMAFDYYLKAHQLRPHRAEPLLKIAEHYWPDAQKTDANIPACFLFARRAYDLAYPAQDSLGIDSLAYDYTKYDMISKSAWYVGEYALGQQATLQAIKSQVPHLYNNLTCYKTALTNK